MALYLLTDDLFFPDPKTGMKEGLLAVGGDLSPSRLLLAYEKGIFPWYGEEDPLLWWSPDPRCVLKLENLKVSKSFRNILNRKDYEVKFDTSFDEVVVKCKTIDRKDEGTWIDENIRTAYRNLHELGVAHSIETWKNGKLIGGLYGVSLGRMFFGESMFSEESNGSKIALFHLIQFLKKNNFGPIDCQIQNPHLESLGAEDVSRDKYLRILDEQLNSPTLKGNWGDLQ